MEFPSCFCSTEKVMRLFPSTPPTFSCIPRFIISTIYAGQHWQGWFKKSKDGQNYYLHHLNASVRRGSKLPPSPLSSDQIEMKALKPRRPAIVQAAVKKAHYHHGHLRASSNLYWFRFHFYRHIFARNSLGMIFCWMNFSNGWVFAPHRFLVLYIWWSVLL